MIRPAAVLSVLMLGALAIQPPDTGAFAQTTTTQAQKPTPPAKPTVSKPVAAKPKAPEAPASGAMTLLCRSLGQNNPGGASLNQSALVYERITIKDASGATKSIYAPVSATITNGFTPAATIVSARDNSLGQATCGLTTSVIAPVGGSSIMKLILADPPGFGLSSGANRPGGGALSNAFASHDPVVTLPPCPSGVRRFNVQRTSPTEFFVSLASPGATACVD